MKEGREDFVVSELGGWKTISQERWQNYSCLDPWFIPINFDAEMKCRALSLNMQEYPQQNCPFA
jgi:hypothetical protein